MLNVTYRGLRKHVATIDSDATSSLSAWLSPAASSPASQPPPIRSRHRAVASVSRRRRALSSPRTFTGFQDQANHASILLAEFPPVAFTQFRNGLTAEAMAKRGMRLLSTETIEGVPYEQITVRAEQRAGNQVFDKWLMVINGPDMTGMLTVSIAKPAPRQLSDAVIRVSTCQRPDPCDGLWRSDRRPAVLDRADSALYVPQTPGWPGTLC